MCLVKNPTTDCIKHSTKRKAGVWVTRNSSSFVFDIVNGAHSLDTTINGYTWAYHFPLRMVSTIPNGELADDSRTIYVCHHGDYG